MFIESALPYTEFDNNPEVLGFPLSPEVAPQREQVTHIFENARRLNDASYPDEVINAYMKRLGDIPGISLIGDVDYRGEEGLRCAEWAFGFVQGESWSLRGFSVDAAPQLWANPQPFLEYHGYTFTGQPDPGCIIAYGDIFPDGRIWLEHFGIYLGTDNDNRQEYVISKFGQGPVVEHQQSIISTAWGSRYFYLNKTKQPGTLVGL